MNKIVESKSIFAFGNALVDVICTVDKNFLDSFELEEDGVILIGEKQKDICQKLIEKFPYELVAGGSSLNALRMAQWIISKKDSIHYVSCIGTDKLGMALQNQCTREGVKINFEISKNAQTGYCCVMVSKNRQYRSLATHLGATQEISDNFLISDSMLKNVDEADILYVTGFSFMVKPDIVIEYAKSVHLRRGKVLYNVSAPFICELVPVFIRELIKNVDVIFGNVEEFKTLLKDLNENFIRQLSSVIINESNNDVVQFFVTNGPSPTTFVEIRKDSLKKIMFDVKTIKDVEIVDTNGAGDAFVGGFISQYINNKPTEICVSTGHLASNYIIKQSGFCMNTEQKPPFM